MTMPQPSLCAILTRVPSAQNSRRARKAPPLHVLLRRSDIFTCAPLPCGTHTCRAQKIHGGLEGGILHRGHGHCFMPHPSLRATLTHPHAERKKFTEGLKGASFARAFEKIIFSHVLLFLVALTNAERKKFTEGSKGASFARAFEKIMAKNAKVQAKAASKPEAAATAPPGSMPPPILSVSLR